MPGAHRAPTVAAPPDAPTGVSVSNVDTSGMDVAWAAPASNGAIITKYRVFACDVQAMAKGKAA